MDEPLAPIFLRYGGAKKSTFEMSSEELDQAALSILRRAKERSFSKGLPIYFSEGENTYAEYPNGHIEVVNERA